MSNKKGIHFITTVSLMTWTYYINNRIEQYNLSKGHHSLNAYLDVLLISFFNSIFFHPIFFVDLFIGDAFSSQNEKNILKTKLQQQFYSGISHCPLHEGQKKIAYQMKKGVPFSTTMSSMTWTYYINNRIEQYNLKMLRTLCKRCWSPDAYLDFLLISFFNSIFFILVPFVDLFIRDTLNS